QELNEGKERWEPITDPNAASNTQGSTSGSSSGEVDNPASNTPGFESFVALVSLIGCLFILRKYGWGDKK
ncbi:MAG: PGF-CTERM sorting domain-containing protein, partial [archaeon]